MSERDKRSNYRVIAPRGTLLARTLELLKNSEKHELEITLRTGLGTGWICQLRRMARTEKTLVQEPGVNKIQVLYEYLSGDELFDDRRL